MLSGSPVLGRIWAAPLAMGHFQIWLPQGLYLAGAIRCDDTSLSKRKACLRGLFFELVSLPYHSLSPTPRRSRPAARNYSPRSGGMRSGGHLDNLGHRGAVLDHRVPRYAQRVAGPESSLPRTRHPHQKLPKYSPRPIPSSLSSRNSRPYCFLSLSPNSYRTTTLGLPSGRCSLRLRYGR